MASLGGKRILIFVGDDYEDLELWYPKLRLIEAGAEVVVAGEKARHTYRGKHGYPCVSDAAITDMNSADFGGLILVGGWMPDKLRRDANVLRLTREFFEQRKLVASICHGPWIMISAGICRGLRMTSTPGIKDDLINAGATWVDEAVVVDRNVVTSRRPPDLPAFGERIVAALGDEECVRPPPRGLLELLPDKNAVLAQWAEGDQVGQVCACLMCAPWLSDLPVRRGRWIEEEWLRIGRGKRLVMLRSLG